MLGTEKLVDFTISNLGIQLTWHMVNSHWRILEKWWWQQMLHMLIHD